jgi:transposase
VRVSSLVRSVVGLGREVVVCGWELKQECGVRPRLVVRVRVRSRRRGRCGRCGALASFYDQGGGERRWRHVDVGFAVCELVGDAPRVDCCVCGPTVAVVPWARHNSVFTRDFEDLIVYESVVGNKQAVARRYQVSWRAVNNVCLRVAEEALNGTDLLAGLVAVAVDEVKYKKGHKYLTVVCDHFTGKVVWAHEGRSKDVVHEFFNDLGDRVKQLNFVTADGAEWIRDVVALRAPEAIICIDTFHVVQWATKALDELRRSEWNNLRSDKTFYKAKEMKGMRWLLIRNWENLSSRQKGVIRDLEKVNKRMFRGWQLKEELRDIFKMPLNKARQALNDWLTWASRSKLEPFIKLAKTIRHYRDSIEATIEWKLTNGIAESNNAAIGRIRSNARGFHHPKNFITMIHLDRSGIKPNLPWTTN